jgi:hypothetical protein
MARARLQFSLQTLFWLTLVAASFFGGIVTQRWLSRRDSAPTIDFNDQNSVPMP